VEGHDRTNGRVYKVTYGKPERKEVDLKSWRSRALWSWCWGKERLVRAALAPHSAGAHSGGKLDGAARKRLAEIATTTLMKRGGCGDVGSCVTEGVPVDVIQKLLADKNEYVRAGPFNSPLIMNTRICGVVAAVRRRWRRTIVAACSLVSGCGNAARARQRPVGGPAASCRHGETPRIKIYR